MEGVTNVYGSFYDSLASFVNEFPSHLLPQYSHTDGLRCIGCITEILPKGSYLFNSSSVTQLRESIDGTFYMTKLVLNNASRYIKDSSQQWLAHQKTTLEILMQFVSLSSGHLGIVDGSQVQQLEAGIGGVESSSNQGAISASTLQRLKTIREFLE